MQLRSHQVLMEITHLLDWNSSTDGLSSQVSVRWKLGSEQFCCQADLELIGIRTVLQLRGSVVR